MSATKLRQNGTLGRKSRVGQDKTDWISIPVQIPKALYHLLDKNYEDPLGLLNELLIQSILPLIHHPENV